MAADTGPVWILAQSAAGRAVLSTMKFSLSEISLATTERIQVVDITEKVRKLLDESGISQGLLTLISNHTTAFVGVNEREIELQRDMVEFLSKVAPRGAGYRHDVHPVDDRQNAHAHLAGLFMNASESIPVTDGRLLLGHWQSILFFELDGPREARIIHAQILGEP